MSTGADDYTTLVTTPQQREVIDKLLHEQLQRGGIALAQVFSDGMRIKVLTPAQAAVVGPAMAEAMGRPLYSGYIGSAFQKPGGAKP